MSNIPPFHHCPQCKREMHFVCSRKTCRCWDIPEGELPQRWVYIFRGQEVPCEIFHVYWEVIVKGKVAKGTKIWEWLIELLACPYCGYEDLVDNWAELEIQQLFEREGVRSFGELQEKRDANRQGIPMETV